MYVEYWKELEEGYTTMHTTYGSLHAGRVPPCDHQFFHVADISSQPMGMMMIDGKEQIVSVKAKQGTLVMCALCGEQRQLWQDGTIKFFINGEWQKRA